MSSLEPIEATSVELVEEQPHARILGVGPEEQYATLADALGQCSGGEEIQLQPGDYTLDSPVTVAVSLVRAAGSEGVVTISALGTAVRWAAGEGTLRDIRFQHQFAPEADDVHLVSVTGGDLYIEGCELEAHSGRCVHATGVPDHEKDNYSSPSEIPVPPFVKLSGCRLTSTRGDGVKIEWGAGGEVVGCEVTAVHKTAVMVCDAADVAVRRNHIHDTSGAGVFVYGASGLHHVEDNDIHGCGLPSIEVVRQAEPVVRRNKLHGGRAAGLHVRDEGRGTYEDNDIYEHARANVDVDGGSHVVLRANRVRGGDHAGLLFRGRSLGQVEGNEVWGHAGPNVEVRARAAPTLRANRLHGGEHIGLLVRHGGRGSYADNEVSGHRLSGVHVHKGARVSLTANHVHGNQLRGLFVEGDATATLEANRSHDNGVEAPAKEPAKRLLQSWGQWLRWVGWMALHSLADAHEDPEGSYPAGYEMYAHPDYQGDFDGFAGEVVFDARAEAQMAARLEREDREEQREAERAREEAEERRAARGEEEQPAAAPAVSSTKEAKPGEAAAV